MKTIFEYIDYRSYLADYYQQKKETTQYFSYRYFAQKIGINSPSFLKSVIDGKRNLTASMAERFSRALELNTKERSYFTNLVLFNQAKTLTEKQRCYDIMRSMSEQLKESVLEDDQFNFFSNWYIPVIRELVCVKDFKEDYDALGAALEPPIAASRAKASVELLLRLRLIEKTKSGAYKQTSTAVIANESVTSSAVRTFTQTMLDHSKNCLDTVSKENRHISGITMGLSRQTYEIITKEIDAFKERLKIIVNHDTNVDRVYQINVSLFPLSKLDLSEPS
jgi:uncharacterized protein (TIGR02147 family)